MMSTLRGSNFAASTSLETLTLPVHNEALAGDDLTTLALNFEWRKIVASALQFYWSHARTDLAYDNEDLLDDLLIDLYNAEVFGMRNSLGNIKLSANQTRANAAFATVSGSTFAHVFTKPNAKITISTIVANLSNTLNEGRLRIALSAGNLSWQPEAIVPAQTRGFYRAAVVWGNIPIGVSTNIFLEFASAGATTLTLEAAFTWLIEIEEYD